MPLREKKPLYLADNIKDLNLLANSKTDSQNVKLLVKSTEKLLKSASENYLEGDQERAYVLFMRFFNVVTCIKKSIDYNKNKVYYDALIGDKNCKMAIEKAEELSNDLKARYEELIINNNKYKKTTNNLNEEGGGGQVEEEEKKIQKGGIQEDVKHLILCDVSVPHGWVGVVKLYEWFKDENIKVLLVDTRSEEQFSASCITKFSDVINTPNIPPGSTAKSIETRLNGNASLCWSNRAKYDIIVFCDLCTTNQTFDETTSELATLKAALVKWDLETKLKNEPLLLMGGYKEWTGKFPMFVNNPLPKEESFYSSNNKLYSVDVKALLDSIDYDIDLSYLDAPSAAVASDTISSDANRSVPSIPIFDRSKKPKGELVGEINKTDIHKEPLTNGVTTPNISTNVPAAVANRKLKPILANQEISAYSSFNNDMLKVAPHGEQSTNNAFHVVPSEISRHEVKDVEQLKMEILMLEEKKKKLEAEVATIDKQKAMESDKTKVGIGSEHQLSQEKAKQAKEVATLLREKRKLAQELSEMEKQKDRIRNEQAANQIPRFGSSKADDESSNSSHNSVNGHSSPTFPEKIITIKDNSPINQTTNVNLHEKSSTKPDVVQKLREKSSSSEHHVKPALVNFKSDVRASPKKLTVRLDVEESPTASDEESPTASDEAPKSNLKRFHSFPNIAKLSEEADEVETSPPQKQEQQGFFETRVSQPMVAPVRTQVQPPRVDRSIKPNNSFKSLLEAKVRNFQATWGSLGLGLTGLRNLGNTCYMNSIVQCLSNCFIFSKYFSSNIYHKDINWANQDGYRGEVAIEFAMVIKNIWSGQYKAISPFDFRAVVSKFDATFASTQHQDAHELLEFLMNGLNEDLNRVKVKPQLKVSETSQLEDEVAAEKAWQQSLMIDNSVIIDLFRGQYKSRVMCSFCDAKSTVFEPFMSLNLQIPENQSKCSLSDCLLHFSNEEKMTGDSKWLCPKCKQKRESTKRIVVWRLPQILIIHLKRFHYQGIWRNKISTNVSFPLTKLDMSRYLSGPTNCESNCNTMYNLFAVCNHYGTLDGGHYTAFCKNVASRNWYKFDDSEVSEISSSSIQSPAAYLLFYAKSGLWPQ